MSRKGFIEVHSETEQPETGKGIAPLENSGHIGSLLNRNKLRMGLWDRIQFNRETGELVREKLGDVASALVEKQKSEIIHGLMLELDQNKKEAYAKYIQSVGKLNDHLVRQSNKMENELSRTMYEEISKAYELKKEWSDKINDLRQRGLLSDTEYDAEITRMERWIEITKANIEGKIELVVRTHVKSLQSTLELLRDKSLDPGRVL